MTPLDTNNTAQSQGQKTVPAVIRSKMPQKPTNKMTGNSLVGLSATEEPSAAVQSKGIQKKPLSSAKQTCSCSKEKSKIKIVIECANADVVVEQPQRKRANE